MANCVWMDTSDDGPSVGSEVLRHARVAHKCGECGEVIKPGALYEHATGCWDGRWSSHKTCARCVNVRTDHFPEGWMYGHMVDDFKEAFGFDYRDGIPGDFAPCRRGAPKPSPETGVSGGTVTMGGARCRGR